MSKENEPEIILQTTEIFYNKKDLILMIGKRSIPMKIIESVVGKPDQAFDVVYTTINLDNKNCFEFGLTTEAYKKVWYCIAEYKARYKGKIANCPPVKGSGKIFGISKEFIILYIILIIGFASPKLFGEELETLEESPVSVKEIVKTNPKILPDYNKINEGVKPVNTTFEFRYIFDVDLDVCITTDAYKNKFSYNDLKNPRLVVEFENRPGELTLITPTGEMYIFTDTLSHCEMSRLKFREEMKKQNKAEENKYEIVD